MFPCSRAPSLRCAAAPSTSSPVPQGFCSFVSAGPGTVDLLTVKGLRLLKGPHSVVVHDDLVDASILAEIPPGTRTILVGKRGGDNTSWKQSDIDKLLVDLVQQGEAVVRLKGGCASMFARLTSEIWALEQAGVPYEIVPGVTSALAAPLVAGIGPATHKHLSRAVGIVSAHIMEAVPAEQWRALVALDTLIVLMGGRNLPHIMAKYEAAGRGGTPVAVIQNAGLPSMRVWRGTAESIVSATAGASLSPCIVVVGDIVEWKRLTESLGLMASVGGEDV